ncbi:MULTISPECIES: response regulator transcription factor [Pseudomonas]|uniref:response regulator transcription factor n=1 Tax=Pseudomonas TaxID=286 RepID=UPI001F362E06|nr:response regulator transcription factor [Pseudomonas sputi]
MIDDSSVDEPSKNAPVVYVVDDESSIRKALDNLFRSEGIQVNTFETTSDFLKHPKPDSPSCLVLDVRLQGFSGLDFQNQMAESKIKMPIIFITGHGDIAMSVKAMKAGASDFLAKPFRDQDLLDAVSAALQKDERRRELEIKGSDLQNRFQSLTARERQVMAHAARGLMNKQIAEQLHLSEITVKIHRGHAMKKMNAKSFADLVRMAESLGMGQ